MKTFAHHYSDTPHGVSHPTISVSVLISVLFLGVQFVIWIVVAVMMPLREQPVVNMYGAGSPFAVLSATIAFLLLAYLAVDLWRNRIEAHGSDRYQYVVFAVAALVVASFVYFLSLTMGPDYWCRPERDVS